MTAQKTIMQETIIEELGLQELPKEKQEELLVKIGEVVMKRIYLDTMEKLEKEDQEKLIDLMEKNPEGIEVFLQEKIPDYEDFVQCQHSSSDPGRRTRQHRHQDQRRPRRARNLGGCRNASFFRGHAGG